MLRAARAVQGTSPALERIDGVKRRPPPRLIVPEVLSSRSFYFPGSRARVWSRGTQAVSVRPSRGYGNDPAVQYPEGTFVGAAVAVLPTTCPQSAH